MILYFFFFFFQAEDGIRDKLVTGVQTCALPRAGRHPLRPTPQSGSAANGLARVDRLRTEPVQPILEDLLSAVGGELAPFATAWHEVLLPEEVILHLLGEHLALVVDRLGGRAHQAPPWGSQSSSVPPR